MLCCSVLCCAVLTVAVLSTYRPAEMLYTFLRVQEQAEKEKAEKEAEERKAAERASGKRKKEQSAVMARLATIGGGKPKYIANSAAAAVLFDENSPDAPTMSGARVCVHVWVTRTCLPCSHRASVDAADIKQIIAQAKSGSNDPFDRRNKRPVRQLCL